jgi:hypothetical protein
VEPHAHGWMGFTAGRLLNLFHLLEFGLAKPPLAVKEARKSYWNNKVAASRKLQELTVALLNTSQGRSP